MSGSDRSISMSNKLNSTPTNLFTFATLHCCEVGFMPHYMHVLTKIYVESTEKYLFKNL